MSSSTSQPIHLLYQALSLDCSVLEALLKKHRNSHGRTIYFRRMKMVLRAVQKWQPMSLESDFEVLIQKIQGLKKKKKSSDEEWSIYAGKSKENDPNEDIQQSWKEIVQTIEEGFPEVISRILHASKALMTEIQRGFFLPFCTVALAALARISCLHKRIGNWAISELQNLQATRSAMLQLPQDFMQRTTETFLECSSDEREESFDNEALLASMGIVSKKQRAINITNSQDGSENDETAAISQPAELDNDDIGESLVAASVRISEPNLDKGSKPKKLAPASSIVDQNLAMLERLKEGERGGQGKKKKSKKRKEASLPEGPADIDGNKKKKKKKKKSKNKGKNFFDDLFD